MNLFDLNEKSFGKFDVIIFPGTLYHLRYPFQALKIVTSILKEDGILLIETAILQESFDRAILYCPVNNDGPFGSTSCTFFHQGFYALPEHFARFIDFELDLSCCQE